MRAGLGGAGVFVVDDFGAWLVGALADAGLKKLTTLVLGSDQERALRQAARTAVQQTVDELSPADDERAEQLAMRIGKAFKKPMPDAPLAVQATLLETLQTGVRAKLAALDGPGVAGAEQSPADVLGVPASVLADRLADHLVQEIIIRGSQGGLLTALADQFNQDRTHIQVAELTSYVREALSRAGSAVEVASQAMGLLSRPAYLVGREELLADLDARLTLASADCPRVVALFGLGGIGKTSIALEYAYREIGGLGVAWQLAAQNPTALAAGFGDLAAQLGARDRLAAGDPVAQVYGMLAARPGDWLLIFDNAPGPAALQAVLPPKGAGPGHNHQPEPGLARRSGHGSARARQRDRGGVPADPHKLHRPGRGPGPRGRAGRPAAGAGAGLRLHAGRRPQHRGIPGHVPPAAY